VIRLSKKKGNSFARKIVAGVSIGIMALFIFLSAWVMNHTLVTICFVFAEFFLGIIVITCFSTCIDIGGDRVSTVTGFMNFFGQMGAFLMSIVFGKIVDLTHNYEMPQYLMFSLLLVGGLCWLGIDASKKIIVEPGLLKIIPG